ncbi:MAG: hypothetical protein U9R74_20010 [Pseudomonadota bacterium]|nr:hypothetical protein [Pseudomonadota bacterium]
MTHAMTGIPPADGDQVFFGDQTIKGERNLLKIPGDEFLHPGSKLPRSTRNRVAGTANAFPIRLTINPDAGNTRIHPGITAG